MRELSIVSTLDKLSQTELQVIIQRAMQLSLNQLQSEVEKLGDKFERAEESRQTEFKKINENHEKLRKLELKRHRTEEHRFGFVSLNDLGQCFQVSIGAKTMGKLLRIVGLAKAKQSKTEPLRSTIIDGYAKSLMYGDYPAFQWNPEKCIGKIDRWLNAKGLIDEFYAIDSEDELMKYIQQIEESCLNKN